MPRLKIVEEDEVDIQEEQVAATAKGDPMPFAMPPGMEGMELPEEFDLNNPLIQQLLQASVRILFSLFNQLLFTQITHSVWFETAPPPFPSQPPNCHRGRGGMKNRGQHAHARTCTDLLGSHF